MTFLGRGVDSSTLMLAATLRFCADGTLRGPDNCVVARCVEGSWQVGGRPHRDLDCEGPVRVRITRRASDAPEHHGPFQHLRTINGVLHADNSSMSVTLPGRGGAGNAPCHELAFLPLSAPRIP